MTIGIGAFGPNAGLAVFKGLRAAELVGRGAIGGFVAYAALTDEGELLRYETQRGGSRTLFTEGETTGVEPPKEAARATAAAVISSGPDRPRPLAQFLPADPRGGLVSGHRLPNARGVDGAPINTQVLDRLVEGESALQAVTSVLGRNPESDTGIIAVDRGGGVYAQNTARVLRRPDLGHARRENRDVGATVEVLHNAIRPYFSLAAVVADIAMEAIVGEPQPAGWFAVRAGVRVTLGREDTVRVVNCRDQLVAEQVTTTDPVLVSGRQIGAAIYLRSKVELDGRLVGRTMFEPIITVEDGTIVEINGQEILLMSFSA